MHLDPLLKQKLRPDSKHGGYIRRNGLGVQRQQGEQAEWSGMRTFLNLETNANMNRAAWDGEPGRCYRARDTFGNDSNPLGMGEGKNDRKQITRGHHGTELQ